MPLVDGQPYKYIKRKENNLVSFLKKTYADIAQDQSESRAIEKAEWEQSFGLAEVYEKHVRGHAF